MQVIASRCFQDMANAAVFQDLLTSNIFQPVETEHQKDTQRMASPAGCDEWHVQALNWDSSSETWIRCDEAIRLSSRVCSVYPCSSHVIYAQYARISLAWVRAKDRAALRSKLGSSGADAIFAAN